MNNILEKRKILKQLKKYFGDKQIFWRMLFLTNICLILISLIEPYFYQMFLEDILVERNIFMLKYVIGGYIAIYFLKGIFKKVQLNCTHSFFNNLKLGIRLKLIDKFFSIENDQRKQIQIGDMKKTLVNDVEVLQPFIEKQYLNWYIDIGGAFFILCILIIISWKLTIFGGLMIPLSFVFSKFMGDEAKKVSKEYRRLHGKYETFLYDSTRAWKEIKSNNLIPYVLGDFNGFWEELRQKFFKKQVIWYVNRAFIAFKDSFVTKMNLYFLGGFFVIKGDLEVASILVFMNYYEVFYEKILSLTDAIVTYKIDLPSIESIIEKINLKDSHNMYIPSKNYEINMKNVSFCYQASEKVVLKDINLNIKQGEKVAIIGKSGSGKSTLLKLLLKIEKTSEGEVEIGADNILNIPEEILYKKINSVLQEPCFLNMSIKENFMIINNIIHDENIEYICEKVNLLNYIKTLKNGFLTVVGENGMRLSGGQKQRLAIARVILIHPDIVIFDEVTSAMDSENIEQIINAIMSIFVNETIIIISHQYEVIKQFKRVIVLDQGMIIAEGTNDYLKKNCQVYNEIFSETCK